jgi:hypothetical protein
LTDRSFSPDIQIGEETIMKQATGVVLTGPLATYGDGFANVLAERGYKPLTVKGQVRLMAHVSRWLAADDLAAEDLIRRGSVLTPVGSRRILLRPGTAAISGPWLLLRTGVRAAWVVRAGALPYLGPRARVCAGPAT